MEKPLLNLNQTIDKAEEEEKLKTLLRDDFIDDGMDTVQENAPLILPLMDEGFYTVDYWLCGLDSSHCLVPFDSMKKGNSYIKIRKKNGGMIIAMVATWFPNLLLKTGPTGEKNA